MLYKFLTNTEKKLLYTVFGRDIPSIKSRYAKNIHLPIMSNIRMFDIVLDNEKGQR